MLNQAVLVGRVSNIPEIKKEENKKTLEVTISLPRSYKNENGFYDTDFLTCILYNDVANNTKNYLKVGDMIGIKGRIQNINNLNKIIAEKVTFLASAKEE